jgi:phospholipase/lecithinase/hemolysin
VFGKWNEILRKNVKAFVSGNEDVTTMVLSSSDFFNLAFKTPSSYGFEEKDIRKRYGPVWADHIHPTSRIHELFAERVSEFLRSYPVGVIAQTE